jgi:hypothetical protein
MTENIEKKICAWKTNAEFQWKMLGEAEKKKNADDITYLKYERCMKCPGYDETCTKYQEMKSLGMA